MSLDTAVSNEKTPSTSEITTVAVVHNKKDDEVSAQAAQEKERLSALGPDPTMTHKIHVPIDDHMEKLWSNWAKKGVDTNTLSFLMNQYEIPEFLCVAEVNPEVFEIMEPNARNRDEYLKQTQEITANAIMSAGSLLVVNLYGQ